MEKIIVSNSLNSTDFLRTIAKLNKKELALYVYNEQDFLNYILDKNGIYINKEYISSKEEIYIYMNLLNYKYNDAKNVKDSINSYRDQQFGDIDFNKLNDDFKKKKEIIKDAYNKYKQYKLDNNKYDFIDLINYINDNIKNKINTKCIIFNELNISNLIELIIKKYFDYEYQSISNYLKLDNHNEKIIKAYGKTNEIDFVFNELLNYKLGDCQIVLLNNEYLSYVLEYVNRFNIKYTSAIGIPFLNTNSGKLLKCILKMKNNNYDKNSYIELFNNPSFNNSVFKKLLTWIRDYNDFIQYAGWLRIGFNKKNIIVKDLYEDKIYNALKLLNDDIEKGIPYFVNKYSIEDGFNELAYNKLSQIEKLNIDELYDILVNSNINQKISNNDSLHITTLDKAFSSMRPNTFIVGLDSNFPGNPNENYFIYDDEYIIDKYKSVNIIENKKKMLLSFIDLCSNTYLSYSYFKPAEMHEANPSSIIYDRGIEPIDYEYKDSNISNNQKSIYKYIDNFKHERIVNNLLNLDYFKEYLLNKKYSPSGFYKALIEDDKKSFIIQVLLESDVDKEDDPYNIIEANDKGTLIHKLFEEFNKDEIILDEMIKKAYKEFDDFLKIKPALIESKIESERNDFVSLVKRLYEMSSNNKHVLSEVTIDKTNVYGLYFGGQFDRIEKTNDGKYILIDYKTGKNIKHKENDPISCVQGLIYAYLIENGKDKDGKFITDNGNEIKISECKFLYPENGASISIKWNDETKNQLKQLIEGVIKDIESGKILHQDDGLIYQNEILYSLISKVEEQWPMIKTEE